MTLTMELEPYPGYFVYCKCSHIRYLESSPRNGEPQRIKRREGLHRAAKGSDKIRLGPWHIEHIGTCRRIE